MTASRDNVIVLSNVHQGADNFASFGGMYGLGNPTVTWLIGRGFGELVALTPEQMRQPEQAPKCTARAEGLNPRGKWRRVGGRCDATMRYRPEGWVCYEHGTPVRARRAMRLQEAPRLIDYGDGLGAVPYKGSIVELVWLADKQVDVVYQRDPGARVASWRYVVRPLNA
ncbi:MAG: hypothetical protein A3E01_15235 [Gammaproteobacteria bacterium RIFCSPHIGHO2_12_FULL_63_22]|nr:MAG: hypothetical protein A3E01_15235 [Gammaproteobacteria bacterium RIFCSPHIGHO2_12_FULL_63_22]